jgi:hypothetical protein
MLAAWHIGFERGQHIFVGQLPFCNHRSGISTQVSATTFWHTRLSLVALSYNKDEHKHNGDCQDANDPP